MRIGHQAVLSGYMTKRQLQNVIVEQWNQEWTPPGKPQQFGEISVKKGYMTDQQLEVLLAVRIMEPNIRWDEETAFAQALQINKREKQMVGGCVGKMLAADPADITVFLSNSSTIYYAFRGIVKHKADLNVLTIHAAILAVFPSLQSKIRSLRTIWHGRVDLDNALIEPDNLDDRSTKEALSFLDGEITHALLSPTGFDHRYGPMGINRVAREVARRTLQSGTPTYLLIDHTKVRTRTQKHASELLFSDEHEWRTIRNRGSFKIIVDRHPNMPRPQADLDIASRSRSDIQALMLEQKATQAEIDGVLQYQDWAMSLRGSLKEVTAD